MEQQVYDQVKVSVRKLLNIDLNCYKDEQVRRRLDSWLVRSGMQSWPEYFKKLQDDEKELSRFRDYLTINVSEFFRDPERWQSLKKDVLPRLLQEASSRPGGGARIWSAGCSFGAEPYTLTILLNELAPGKPHYLLATDLDRSILARARGRGPFTLDEIRNIDPVMREKYFDQDGQKYFIKERFGKLVTFKEQNLVADQFERDFDLIVCRNVIIYFTADAKSELYSKFYNSLRTGGVLFLGGTEIIPRPVDFNFKNQGVSFYVKQG